MGVKSLPTIVKKSRHYFRTLCFIFQKSCVSRIWVLLSKYTSRFFFSLSNCSKRKHIEKHNLFLLIILSRETSNDSDMNAPKSQHKIPMNVNYISIYLSKQRTSYYYKALRITRRFFLLNLFTYKYQSWYRVVCSSKLQATFTILYITR